MPKKNSITSEKPKRHHCSRWFKQCHNAIDRIYIDGCMEYAEKEQGEILIGLWKYERELDTLWISSDESTECLKEFRDVLQKYYQCFLKIIKLFKEFRNAKQ